MTKTFREVEGEFLLSKTSLDGDMQEMIDMMAAACIQSVPKEYIERFAALIYKQGYQTGKIETMLEEAKKGE